MEGPTLVKSGPEVTRYLTRVYSAKSADELMHLVIGDKRTGRMEIQFTEGKIGKVHFTEKEK